MIDLALSVLREPRALVDRLAHADALATAAPRLLGLSAIGCAAFGAAVGAQRDVVQLLYAAVKLPAVVIVPMLVAVPAIRAMAAAWGPEASATRAAAAGLVGGALTGVLAAGLAPVVWLALAWGLPYAPAVVFVSLALGACGAPGVLVIGASLSMGAQRWARGACVLGAAAILGAVSAQTGWLLRPFVARPDIPVVFLRGADGDAFRSLGTKTVAPPRPADPERIEHLRALGYL